MMRKIIVIDQERCDGCGLCTGACHESALSVVDGKARLVRGVYCDGIGSCLPVCPRGALAIAERETGPFDLMAARLNQWPVQLKLVSPAAAFFRDASLLISADCAAYSYGNYHNDFMKGKSTVIGCPKLDMTDYTETLAAIFKNNAIKSITVVRMQVPCCQGITVMTEQALKQCGRAIPLTDVTLAIDGQILDQRGPL